MGRIFALLFLVGACGGGGGGGDDDAVVHDAAPTCDDFSAQFEAAAQGVDNSCDTPDDCAYIGGQYEQTCDCTPALAMHPVRVGSDHAHADEIYAAWKAACDMPQVCDQSPPTLDCVNHHCTLADNSCLDVDAGP